MKKGKIGTIMIFAFGALLMVFAGFSLGMGNAKEQQRLETEEKAACYDADGFFSDALDLYAILLEDDKLKTEDRSRIEKKKIVDMYQISSMEFVYEAENYLKVYGEDVEVMLLLGQYYEMEDQYKDALKLYERCSEIKGEDSNIARRIASVREKKDDIWSEYSDFESFQGGYGIAVLKQGEEDRKQLVNQDGKLAIQKGYFCEIYDYALFEGERSVTLLASVMFEDGTVGYVDQDNNLRKIPQENYDYLGCPHDGYILVSRSGKWGYLNVSDFSEVGEWYEDATAFSDGIAMIKREGEAGWRILSADETVSESIYEDICMDSLRVATRGGVIWTCRNGKYSLIDKDGNIISRDFDEVKPFSVSGGTSAVKLGNKWGLVNAAGELEVGCEYEETNSGTEETYAYKENRKWGFCYVSGDRMGRAEYEEVGLLGSSGSAFVKEESGWALITYLVMKEEEGFLTF